MTINMGRTDRTIRIVLGLAVIAAGVYYKNWWGALGVIPLVTSIISWCPMYVPFGLSTCRKGR
jgi:hypothetical protein